MSRIQGKNTRPEILLRSMLHRAGFRFRIHDKKLPGRPDIVLPRYRSVIFVNGCFWHRHPSCKEATVPSTRTDFWLEKFIQTVKRDSKKTAELETAGWQVLVVWECELKKQPQDVLSKVIIMLKKE